jgi:hypothetical protein
MAVAIQPIPGLHVPPTIEDLKRSSLAYVRLSQLTEEQFADHAGPVTTVSHVTMTSLRCSRLTFGN